MIFCEKLLFLHVPKTGGMSVTDFLLRVCPRPTYYTHPDSEPRLRLDGVHEIDGIRHETLEEAARLVKGYGFDLAGFALILAIIRNPYAIEVSRFGYYQKGHPWDAHHKGRNDALAGDFRSFALNAEPHGGTTRGISCYFLINEIQPQNLRLARYEHLVPDVHRLLKEAGIFSDEVELPHHNASVHKPWREYYDAETEAAVFSRYRWLFEGGFYERLEVASSG